MQLMLMFGIAFAIASVTFALQNNVPTSVSFALWRFDSSLAVILLLAVGLGVLITGLVSSPSVINMRWANSRLRRHVAELQKTQAESLRRIDEMEEELARSVPVHTPALEPVEDRPYVGLRELMAGGTRNTP